MSCSIGSALNHECSDEPPQDFRRAESYTERQLAILKLRCEVTADITSVCQRHHTKFWRCYFQKYCCDPMDLHQGGKRLRGGMFTISAEFHDVYHELCPRVVQGRKLCVYCKIQLSKKDIGRPRARYFNLEQKMAILDRLAAGETVAELAAEHKTMESSIQNILKREQQIRLELAQQTEVKAELLTAQRELRHRVNVGSAFKMEFGGAKEIYVQDNKLLQPDERLQVVSEIDRHLGAIEEAGNFFLEHDKLERGKAIAKRLTRVSNLARAMRKEYELPKKRGRRRKVKADLVGDGNQSVMVGECDVEVKVEIKEEEPLEIEED